MNPKIGNIKKNLSTFIKVQCILIKFNDSEAITAQLTALITH